MTGLVVTPPMAMTDAMLVSSDVPEADYAEYNAATTYALGDRVMLLSTHSVYESSASSNVGHDPATSPTYWTRVRATNRWRVFDGSNSSRTEQATGISYVIAPGVAINRAALLNVSNCTSVRLRMVDATYGTVYDRTVDMTAVSPSPDWWDWFFGVWIPPSTRAVFPDISSYPNAEMHLDVTGGADLAIGALVFGQSRTWGEGVSYGARLGRQVYSTRKVNEYGDIQFTKRPSSRRSNFELLLPNTEVDELGDYLDSLDAEPALYEWTDRYEAGTVFGIYQQMETVLSYVKHSQVQFQLLGLT